MITRLWIASTKTFPRLDGRSIHECTNIHIRGQNFWHKDIERQWQLLRDQEHGVQGEIMSEYISPTHCQFKDLPVENALQNMQIDTWPFLGRQNYVSHWEDSFHGLRGYVWMNIGCGERHARNSIAVLQ